MHLRHRLGRDLFGHDLSAGGRRPRRRAPAARGPGGPAVQAQRPGLRARHLQEARRHPGNLPRPLRGPRLAGAAVRRRGRGDPRVRPAHRPQVRRAAGDQGLRQLPLRHAAPHPAAGGQVHPRGDEGPGRLVRAERQAAGGPAPGAAHHLRPGDDRDHRLLRRDRELFPLPDRPPARRAAADLLRIHPRQRPAVRRREPPDHSADRRHVQGRPQPQVHPDRVRLPPALGDG